MVISNIAGNLIKRSKRGAELNKVMRIYVTCEGRVRGRKGKTSDDSDNVGYVVPETCETKRGRNEIRS